MSLNLASQGLKILFTSTQLRFIGLILAKLLQLFLELVTLLPLLLNVDLGVIETSLQTGLGIFLVSKHSLKLTLELGMLRLKTLTFF